MQAGRELDVKVAEALGFRIYEDFPVCAIYTGDTSTSFRVFRPSVDWTSMGVLVEEAKKDEIYLDFAHTPNGCYCGFAGVFKDGKYQIDHNTPAVVGAPYAVSLAYLMAKGIAV